MSRSHHKHPHHLSGARLEELAQAQDVRQLSYARLEAMFREDRDLAAQAPEGAWAEDPRNGDRVLFNPARARRPSSFVADRAELRTIHPVDCPICAGTTTAAVDIAPLSEGFTFINKNLFAALFPHAAAAQGEGGAASGLHFLQWTSTLHDRDWHNLSLEDGAVVMRRLAALEQTLLNGAADAPEEHPARSVMIIKNYGVAVGGSLAHGHQQIMVGDCMPRCLQEDDAFTRRHEETFATHMLRRSSADLVVRDYDQALLVVPYYMKRPFDMLLLLKDQRKSRLHEMSRAETLAVVRAWRDVMRAYLRLMPSIGRVPSFNILVHNAPGAGLYFEFLPFTQEYGGFERLGIFVCQSAPLPAALNLRTVFQSLPADA